MNVCWGGLPPDASGDVVERAGSFSRVESEKPVVECEAMPEGAWCLRTGRSGTVHSHGCLVRSAPIDGETLVCAATVQFVRQQTQQLINVADAGNAYPESARKAFKPHRATRADEVSPVGPGEPWVDHKKDFVV